MGETTITVTQMVAGTEIVVTAGIGTAINTGNTMVIPYPKQGRLILYIDSNHADTAAVFTAGVGVSSALGTFTWSVADTVAEMIMLDSDRLVNGDGDLEITWSANSAGFWAAWKTI